MTTASASAVGPPPGMAVRLSSNESAFGPAPAAIEAASAALHDAHRYPDDQSVQLRTAIAEHEGVSLDEVAVGTGSAALLMDAIEHLCRVDDSDDAPGQDEVGPAEVVGFARSFVVYRLAADRADARYIEVETDGAATGSKDGYGRNVDALLAAVTDRTRVVAIDNPGNPTGAYLTGDELRRLIEQLPDHVTVIIDEAYHHFATDLRGYATLGKLGLTGPRLLTLRTFSKAHALAGMRIGYMTGPAELIAAFDARRTRFNVTAPAQAAAVASLGATEHLAMTIEGTLAGRARMAEGLADLSVAFTNGLGNFLTIELGMASTPIVDAYASRGIGVRALAPYNMNEQIRVTVGTPDEVDAFLAASRFVLADINTGL